MTLIEKWRDSWKLTSVQWSIVLAVANALFAIVPTLIDSVPLWLYAMIMSACNIIVVVLRLVAQPKNNS